MITFVKRLFCNSYVCQSCGKSVATRYEILCEECERELK